MSQSHRIHGGMIDRSTTLNFQFNGQEFQGHPGDTLASALLANGVKLIGRSFKYHRPRGVFAAGSDEPNAMVHLGSGAHTEPNTKATTVALFEGLTATSQHHRGSLNFDLLAVNDLFAPFLSAGFYYKTFMWPKSFWEKVYEPAIRASAGLGALSGEPDPDHYAKGFLHCDMLIIGGGPAGLASAVTAGRAGARVILADEDAVFGGRLLSETYPIDDMDGRGWAANITAELAAMTNVTLLPRTTVYGAYDHGIFGALQHNTDHLPDSGGQARQTAWRIYAKQALLCAGAGERSIAFGNNDRPGIMLAGAVRSYVNRFAVAPGKDVAIFTNNDNGWRTAVDLVAKGIRISAIIDTRSQGPAVTIAGADVVLNGRIVDTKGRKGLKAITLADGRTIGADCLAVSGGWNPAVQLTCHKRGLPQWRSDIAAFVPGSVQNNNLQPIGAANGTFGLAAILAQAAQRSAEAVAALGFTVAAAPAWDAEDEPSRISAFWHVQDSTARAWVDLQNDVTAKDIAQSYREGFRAPEHVKRYTTLGMATDQGKTANVLALGILSEVNGTDIAETGTTIYRPPYSPVAIGAFAGRARGKDFKPTRLTPSHKWAMEQGAVFVEAGQWLRAQWFPKPGETDWRQSVDREVAATRASVGICDVTTLGKIDVQGRDAAEFLNKVYCNGFAKLAVGKTRYGLMLREDGLAMDDGTTARLGETHFVMTTTTANAVGVFRHLEFCRQCLWPGMDVHIISATEQWAQYAIAGPNARNLLQKLIDSPFDISNTAFPFMACSELHICSGIPARLFRISFSGELAYELAVPTRYGDALIRKLMTVGKEFNAVAYGTEALGVMRIEKGHAAGNELNGQTTARDLGMGRMVSQKKDSIGSILSQRSALNAEDGLAMVGFKPADRQQSLKAGAHFVDIGKETVTANDLGWMSSVAYSPTLGHAIGLGFIRCGQERMGETVRAIDLLSGMDIHVEITSPHFFDPEGERLRG